MKFARSCEVRGCLAVEGLESRELPTATGLRLLTAITAEPPAVKLHLGSSPAGDFGYITAPKAVLRGKTAPCVTVTLNHLSAAGDLEKVTQTTADRRGEFRFAVRCARGTTTFTARVATPKGPASASLAVTRSNQVVAWNSVALQAVRITKLQAPDAARALAIVQVSVYDAVNAIDRRHRSYGRPIRNHVGEPSVVAESAAAAVAAERALAGLFPAQSAMLEAQLRASLAAIPDGAEKAWGRRLGIRAAKCMLILRSDDGSEAKVDYMPGTGPDAWVPTPSAFAAAVDPQWGRVMPFALESGAQFQPPPPPAITSAQFAAEVNQVRVLGGTDSTVRTPDQTDLAHFWSDLAGTFTPPGHWNQIAEMAVIEKHSGIAESARSFALLDMALADAGIAAWGVKYAYNTARPVTIIHDGAQGANPGVVADPTWTPLWSTPAFPSYVSGHSTFSAAAAAVLDSIYGTAFAFEDPGDPSLHLAPRAFANFDQAAQEAGISRIYGGIHYMSDNVAGLELGTEIGQYVMQHALPAREPA